MTNLNQKLTEAIHALIPAAGLMDECRHTNGPNDNPCGLCNGDRKLYVEEPELRHVLWALKVKLEYQYGYQFFDFEMGRILLCDDPGGNVSCQTFEVNERCKYDLTKSLYAQEDSTKEFILNLLTK